MATAQSDLAKEILDLARERSLTLEQLEQALEEALQVAYKKNFHVDDLPENLRMEIDLKKGKVEMYLLKRIVQEAKDEQREISWAEVIAREGTAPVEEFYREVVDLSKLSRIALQAAARTFQQKILEMEKFNRYEHLAARKHQLVRGKVYRVDEQRGLVWLDVDKLDAKLPFRETIPTERYRRGKELDVYVLDVQMVERQRGNRVDYEPSILVSRSHPELLRLLMVREIPEVRQGIVEIIRVVRDPGHRAKVAVRSTDPNVDPVGACIGTGGRRILPIVRNLAGERIDVVLYSEDPKEFIMNALAPIQVPSPDRLIIISNEEGNRKMLVRVPDELYAQAIGKEGRNVRLAARLTEWHIKIMPESVYQELPEMDLSDSEMDPEVVEALRRHGIRKVKDLFSFTYEELELLEGIGKEGVQKIQTFLTEKGIIAPEETES